jgi:hypothetical protein
MLHARRVLSCVLVAPLLMTACGGTNSAPQAGPADPGYTSAPAPEGTGLEPGEPAGSGGPGPPGAGSGQGTVEPPGAGETPTQDGGSRQAPRSPAPKPPAPKSQPPASGAGGSVTWLPPGPADPGDPPPFGWYGNLRDAAESGSCESLRGRIEEGGEQGKAPSLWRALTAVCAAAIEGDESQWVVAEDLAAGATVSDCLDEAARELLDDALTWHSANPAGTPQVTVSGDGAATACLRIDSISVVDADGFADPDAALTGPITGGTRLRIQGLGIYDAAEVRVGVIPVAVEQGEPPEENDGDPYETLEVVTPPVTDPQTVSIVLSKDGREAVAKQQFTYVVP